MQPTDHPAQPQGQTPTAVEDGPISLRSDGQRSRPAAVLIGFLLALTMLELLVRIDAHNLPDPQLWSTPETQFKVDQIRARGHADTVVVGSSIVDVGLDPTRLGTNAYNGSLGAASIGMVAAFTRGVVLPELDPQTIVVGISSRELNANVPALPGIERRFLSSPGARHALGTETLLDRADRVLSDVFYLSRYRTALRKPDTWFGNAKPEWDGTITRSDGMYLGFLTESYHDEPAVLARFRNGALHDFQLGAEEMATLRSLLVDMHAQGRRVLLLAVPVSQDYIDAYPNGIDDHDRFLAAVQTLADETGAGFLSAGVWDRSLMADPLHSNGAGNKRLSSMAAAALR